jgi:hypothetical protein
MRRRRRRTRTQPPRPSQAPAAAGGPELHLPRWGVLAEDRWFTCPICTSSDVHSALMCGRCGVRPACCECICLLELDPQPRCPLCQYEGPQ